MAVGCYQPDLMDVGEVRKFRLSLWAEHFKTSEPVFLSPSSLECNQRVKLMASYNWGQYLSNEPGTTTPGHILPYPLNVMQDGTLEYIDAVSNFPDFPASAKVMGKKSAVLPSKVTT
jgi:phospholipase D1/2